MGREVGTTEVELTLQRIEIFSRLNKRQLGRLARLATSREFPAGTRIIRRGDTGVALYVICAGRVSVSYPSEEGGAEMHVGDLGPGQVFGEMALIDEGPRSATVTATEPTRCLLLSRWDFGGEMRQDPEIARALLPVLCSRIRTLQERLLKYEAEATRD